MLSPDRLDPRASVDEMLITLLPTESHRFLVRSTEALAPQDLTSRPVLYSANTLKYPRPSTDAGTS